MASKKTSLLLDRALDDFVDRPDRKRKQDRSDWREGANDSRKEHRSDGPRGRGETTWGRDRGEKSWGRGDDRDQGRRDDRDRNRGRDDNDRRGYREKKRGRDQDDEVRLGRGGRLGQSRADRLKPAEVQRAKGRDQKTRGTLSSRPTTVKISNIHPEVDLDMLKELLQGATGKIADASLKDGVAMITYEKPNAASKAKSEFDGGEIAERKIKVEMVYDESESEDGGWLTV
eukprot:TRINITY_DN4773_c1_g1_i1.p1 TRINITY_DN4773_c1_g1~~TRINITY_DN4773_c1_g1_i1.p1  ORF type:complete len:230 (-),score=29.38 TRINITY_DN4773_c1_g1_i1:128-817(-)